MEAAVPSETYPTTTLHGVKTQKALTCTACLLWIEPYYTCHMDKELPDKGAEQAVSLYFLY